MLGQAGPLPGLGLHLVDELLLLADIGVNWARSPYDHHICGGLRDREHRAPALQLQRFQGMTARAWALTRLHVADVVPPDQAGFRRVAEAIVGELRRIRTCLRTTTQPA